MDTNGGRPTPLCGPAAVLVAVHVKIEVFLRHFVVGAVFTHLAQRFIKRGFQLGVVLTQADTGAVAKVLFVFNGRAGEGEIFPGRLFQEAFAGGDFILQRRIQTASCEV